MTAKEPCPRCREQGKDRSGDNLVRYPNGGAHCFSCGYNERSGASTGVMMDRAKSKLTIQQVASYPVGGLPSRGVPDHVAEMYGIRHSYGSENVPDTVYYPYYSGETLQGYKVRKEPKSFSVVGEITGLFGAQCASTKSGVLIVTEGEEDALATRAILDARQKDYGVVSLPNGAQSNIKEHLDFFTQYKKVYLCLDADEPGRAARERLADWLSTLTSVYLIDLDPAIGKDASDYWVAGKTNEFLTACRDATRYEPEDVVNGVDISLDSLLEPLEEGYKIPFPGMQDKLHGLRKSEIVTLCAGSGVGKSTLSRELAKSLIEQGCSVAVVSLEDQMNVAAQALIALEMDVPLNKFRFNPPPREQVQAAYDKMVANGKTYFFKHFGGLTSEKFIDKMYYYARSKRCDFIILDHLSMVISSSDSNNERKDIDTLMTKLAKLVVETGVGVIQVVHLKRPSKDKSFAKGGEVDLSDLRGSAALEQLSWAVVGIERDQQGDDADFSRVRILKNRTFGFTGLCDTLKYNHETGRLVPFTSEGE